MKILQITPSYKPAFIYGGTTVSVGQLCESLAAAGHQVTVLTTTANGTAELPLHDKKPVLVEQVEVYYFNRLTKDHTHFSPSLLWFLYQNAKQYDVVHIQSWWNLVAVFAVLVCWLRGIKPILSPRGMLSAYSFAYENSTKKRLIHLLLGKFLLNRTYIHATAQTELTEAQQVIKNCKGFVLPNLLPLPPVSTLPTPSLTHAKLKLLFLSRIDHKKGLPLLFEVLAALLPICKSQNIEFQLDIIGSGETSYLAHLAELAAAHQLTPYLTWHGKIEGAKRFDYYCQADIFVLPSYNENFANVVIEALSQGTAVWISDKVGLAAYIEQNQMGTVTPLSVESMQKTLLDLMLDQAKRATIRQTAPQKIAQDFDRKNLTSQYVEAYSQYSKGYK
jgi:glycosyltransferase involved in cell wall biosynthesis